MKNNFRVIDIGNTEVKFAYFEGDDIVRKGVSFAELTTEIEGDKKVPTIISSVSTPENTLRVTQLIPDALIASYQLYLPIKNHYSTPKTLGMDRLANAVAIHHLSNGLPAIAIDMGTCLKFDFVTSEGIYQGGSIAPGLRMRFKAMNHFTANLPLIEEWLEKRLVGRTTEESLISGALIGMQNEILGTIERYKGIENNLTVFMTGGDMKYFDFDIKNPIFAHENLTLLGLKLILETNV